MIITDDDRLASLSRRELVGLVAIVVLALGGVGLWYVRSMPRPVEVTSGVQAASGQPGSQGGAAASPSPHSA